jgi:transcriptional regulator with XRE-family HTH domain
MDSAFGGFKTPLQRERKLRRWKQQQVIDRIKQLAHERGYRNTLDGFEVNALSRLENGRIGRPRDPLPELFARLYELPEEVLFPIHGSVWDAAVRVGNQGLGGLSLPSLIEAVDGIWAKLEALSAVLHLDPDMLRRQFLQLLAATGGGALLSPNGASERRLAERAWITALAQESAQFGRRMENAETFGLLKGHRYPHQWADLNVIAAKLCGLLATASSDRFGCYDAAANHLRTAWLCADKAGHSELKAWVLGIRSTVDFWLGNYQQAADRASEGRQYATRGTELVRLGSLEARARGSLGDRNGVQEAVQLAASARETLDDADEARHIGIFAFPIANQVRCAGNAHMWLSDPRSIETARHELEEALRLFEAGIPHQSYAHIAVTRVDLTIVDLRLGQLDTAAATMQPVLGLPTDRRLAGVVRRSGELRRQLAAPQYRRASLARELGQAVEGFCASSVTRQLAGSTVR